MADELRSGRRFRTFDVIDEFTREGLRIEADTSLPSERVVRALNEPVEESGAPLALWAQSKGIALQHIQPGKSTQNAYLEWFNSTNRTEVLHNPQAVRDMMADWLHRYNHQRPHEALGRIPPVEHHVKPFPDRHLRLTQVIEETSKSYAYPRREILWHDNSFKSMIKIAS